MYQTVCVCVQLQTNDQDLHGNKILLHTKRKKPRNSVTEFLAENKKRMAYFHVIITFLPILLLAKRHAWSNDNLPTNNFF